MLLVKLKLARELGAFSLELRLVGTSLVHQDRLKLCD